MMAKFDEGDEMLLKPMGARFIQSGMIPYLKLTSREHRSCHSAFLHL